MREFGVRVQLKLSVDILFRWSIGLLAAAVIVSQFVLGSSYLLSKECAMSALLLMVSVGVTLLPVPGAELHLPKRYECK